MLLKSTLPLLSLPLLLNLAHASECDPCSPCPTYCCEEVDCCLDNCCPDDGRFTVFGNYLYWQVKEDQLQYAIDVVGGLGPLKSLLSGGLGPQPQFTQDVKVKQAASKWNSGFKVGIDYSLECTGWDFALFWTYLHGHTHSSISDPAGGIFPVQFPLSSLFDITQDNPTLGTGAHNKWTYQFDTLDFQIGKTFFPNNCVFIRPFFGVKGALLNQKLFTTYDGFSLEQDDGALIPVAISVTKKNNFHAIGPSIGMESAWLIGCNFSLTGGLSFAFLYGEFENRLVPSISFGEALVKAKIKEDSYRLRPTSNAWVGFDWRNSCFFLGVAFEVQYFWNQWQTPSSFELDILNASSSAQGDLTLYGLTVQAGFAF